MVYLEAAPHGSRSNDYTLYNIANSLSNADAMPGRNCIKSYLTIRVLCLKHL